MNLYDIEKILLYLDEPIREMKIHVLDDVSSTNDYAKKMVFDKNINTPFLILARSQSSGRGQHNRKFYSPEDCGIYMSFVVNPEIKGEELIYITLMCGLCVKDALKSVCNIDCTLKYVNDVLYEGKKLCGILTESVFEGNEQKAVIIGIGLNVKRFDYPNDISDIVTNLEENIEEKINTNKLTAEIVNNIFKGLKNFNIDKIKKLYLENVVALPDDNLIK